MFAEIQIPARGALRAEGYMRGAGENFGGARGPAELGEAGSLGSARGRRCYWPARRRAWPGWPTRLDERQDGHSVHGLQQGIQHCPSQGNQTF